MPKSQPRITLSNLPARARQLNASEMASVFGGCVPAGNTCDKNGDCCPGSQCKTYGSAVALGAMGVWQMCGS